MKTWIRVVYLLPLVLGLLLLLFALIPHTYFVYKDAAYENQSLFTLLGNTWDECRSMLKNEAATQYAQYAIAFSYIMLTVVILVWIFDIVYAAYAILTAVFSIRAFSVSPTDRIANRSKRWLHLLCPNRFCYVILGLLPILQGFFPSILSYCYRTRLGLDMRVYYLGIHDPIVTSVLVLLTQGAFLLTLRAQSREHMDMFRLYKKKPKEDASKE